MGIYSTIYNANTPHPTIEKLHGFKNLDKGWHYGEGTPPDDKMIKVAIKFLERAIFASFETDVFPGIDGEIMVTVYHKNNYLEFTINIDNTVNFIHEVDKRVINEQYDFTVNDAMNTLRTYIENNHATWNNTSESCIKSIGTTNNKDSSVWRLKIHHLEVSRSFPKNVSTNPGNTSASTFVCSMIPLVPNHQYSSGSTWRTYP